MAAAPGVRRSELGDALRACRNAFIGVGLTVKLGWDRWGWLPVNKPQPPPGVPMWFLLAMAVAAVLAGFTVREFLRARLLRAVEAEKFARLLVLRRALELDT